MTIYKITPECFGRDYTGCGKAWAAIQEGEVIGLRYMGDSPIPGRGLYHVPDWIKAVMEKATGLDHHNLPVCTGSRALSELAAAASACVDCPRPPRRKRYRPTELLTMARAALLALDDAAFSAYRTRCRAELAALATGVEVISGMASCTEFVVR